MSRRGEATMFGTRMRVLTAAVGLLAALFLLAPRDVRGATTNWKECVDEAFAGYNDCLMESTSWFNRKLCDLDWELDTALCTARALGDIKNAFNEGSSDEEK